MVGPTVRAIVAGVATPLASARRALRIAMVDVRNGAWRVPYATWNVVAAVRNIARGPPAAASARAAAAPWCARTAPHAQWIAWPVALSDAALARAAPYTIAPKVTAAQSAAMASASSKTARVEVARCCAIPVPTAGSCIVKGATVRLPASPGPPARSPPARAATAA